MQDHLVAAMEQIPPNRLPSWLQERLDAEAKKLAETDQGTEDGNKSIMEDAKRTAGESILEQDLSGASAVN